MVEKKIEDMLNGMESIKSNLTYITDALLVVNKNNEAIKENVKKCENVDPKFLGLPNINFSLDFSEDDDRNEKYKNQRLERGFDDSELYEFGMTIIKFILPRYKQFCDVSPDPIHNSEKFIQCMEDFIKEKIEDEDITFLKENIGDLIYLWI